MTDTLNNLIVDARDWKTAREALSAREESNNVPSASEWETSDDNAAEIAHRLATLETSHTSSGYSLHPDHVTEPVEISHPTRDEVKRTLRGRHPGLSHTQVNLAATSLGHYAPSDITKNLIDQVVADVRA